jgi:altronate hydrolase/galactarate dehydratase
MGAEEEAVAGEGDRAVEVIYQSGRRRGPPCAPEGRMLDAVARIIRLHPDDNVVIALADLPAGAAPEGLDVALAGPAPRGHKIASRPIARGENVIRYGQIIGQATADIAAGAHVHVQNLGMGEHDRDYVYGVDVAPPRRPEAARGFLGYARADGRVGTRNYLGVLTSVNCSGSVARFIAEAAERSDWLRGSANLDGVVPIVHGTGCGMSGRDEGYATLFRTLQGYARHPNFAGVLLVGLGCEVMQIPDLVGAGRMRADGAFRYMTIQQTGGTRRTVERGVAILREMAEAAAGATRSPQPAAALTVGLQCGGSDGYSGITANPALGVASDLLVAQGGTTILSETPEIYGAEHLLTRRAVSREVGERLVARIRWWEDYTARNGGEMDNNPSPGNKRGGLTTILEKSLGAVAKGGTAPLAGVYRFAEEITTPGFVFMDSPGYDPCSVTGQVASGATLIVFTTGRGSVSGYKPVPCLKLATNSEMHARMAEDMDVNCGDVIAEGVSLEAKGAEIFERMLATASGARTKSEELGFGGAEFVPWQIGAVM